MATAAAVIFDLDDTLYPERAYAFSGFEAVASAFRSHLGDPVRAAHDMQRLFDTSHRGRVFDTLLAERGIAREPPLLEAMINTYRTHHPRIALHADADAALARLRHRVRLGLITDGPAVSQRAKINALDLVQRLDQIIITVELGPDFSKPHPLAFDTIAQRLDVPNASCVYVADNVAKDFVAPNALGWNTVQIIRPAGIYHNALPAPGGRPRHVIRSLDELEEITGLSC